MQVDVLGPRFVGFWDRVLHVTQVLVPADQVRVARLWLLEEALAHLLDHHCIMAQSLEEEPEGCFVDFTYRSIPFLMSVKRRMFFAIVRRIHEAFGHQRQSR